MFISFLSTFCISMKCSKSGRTSFTPSKSLDMESISPVRMITKSYLSLSERSTISLSFAGAISPAFSTTREPPLSFSIAGPRFTLLSAWALILAIVLDLQIPISKKLLAKSSPTHTEPNPCLPRTTIFLGWSALPEIVLNASTIWSSASSILRYFSR